MSTIKPHCTCFIPSCALNCLPQNTDENTPPSSPAKKNENDGKNLRLFDSLARQNDANLGSVRNRERSMSQIVLKPQHSKQNVRVFKLPLPVPTSEVIKQELRSKSDVGASMQWNQFLRSHQCFFGFMRQNVGYFIEEAYPDDLQMFRFWAEVRRLVQKYASLRLYFVMTFHSLPPPPRTLHPVLPLLDFKAKELVLHLLLQNLSTISPTSTLMITTRTFSRVSPFSRP